MSALPTLPAITRPPRLPDYLTRTQIAKAFSVTEATVSVWVKRHGFPRPIRIGRKLYFDVGKVRAYLEAAQQAEGAAHAS